MNQEIINLNEYSASALAYIGDAVFELLVRDMILKTANSPADKLYQSAKSYVNAAAQAKMYFAILPHLSEEEVAALKRGRNHSSQTRAKNASVSDYRHATGLEALFGYLHLKGDEKRTNEIFIMCIEAVKTNDPDRAQRCAGSDQARQTD